MLKSIYLLLVPVVLCLFENKYSSVHTIKKFPAISASDTLSYDKAKILTLIKNGVEGLKKEFPEEEITIEFSADESKRLVNTKILANGQVVFIYNIEVQGYSIVGYTDLRAKRKMMSEQ
jgi:hypothetical protein